MANILVLGATSAVATEACRLWAARGDALYLVGRSTEKLLALKSELGAAVVAAVVAAFDDLAVNERTIGDAVAQLGRIDVALIAHGDLGDQLKSEMDVNEAARIIHVNFISVVSLLVPLANHMERNRAGALAAITSVAGERGRPRNFTYGASKRAVTTYLQGLRSRLYPCGVSVTNIKLGPTDSPMTVGHPRNVLFATAPRVARDIVRAIDGRAGEVFVPWYWRPVMMLVRRIPEAVFGKIGVLGGR
ncbi:MAG: SDR family NAD(P)-dependent oxidoreductase [Deltaproteobacteria bacterium]|nr:SDR family NAD(P)-dependent oxidoreductase [Deltaproteobacteria bacterium]